MSRRRLAPENQQPESFVFTPENEAWFQKIVKRYPPERRGSAALALLWRAQKQNHNWLSEPAIRHVADRLDMNAMRVLELASFYTMFNLEPVGRHFIQLCKTVPCMLCGSDDLRDICLRVIGPEGVVAPENGGEDGLWSWRQVECLGACVNAPVVQINDDYYEDISPDRFVEMLDILKSGGKLKPGSQTGRLNSAPAAPSCAKD